MSDKEQARTQSGKHITLNYIDFLATSCKKRWRFIDAIYGVMPIFGMVTKKPADLPRSPGERLNALALQIISTQLSDEANIARLIALAEQLEINEFNIALPYPLSQQQLQAICQEYVKPLTIQQRNEQLLITLPSFSS